MKYSITYDQPQTQYIPIEATFDVPDDASVELQFPVWRPGRYERGDFAKNIHSFQVYNESGKKVEWFKLSKDSWKVDTSNCTQINVRYKYYAAELNAGSTYMDDQQLYVNGVNCLIYIKNQINQTCSLKLNIPEHFEIACGKEFNECHAQFNDYHELVDSPFIASASLKHLKFDCKGVAFHLWFQGDCQLNESRLLSDFEKYTIAQIEQFETFPVATYHYLFQILPITAYHGVEHQTSTVIALGPTYDLMGKLYDELLGVSSHELYHTWNVKALRPQEMYPYDYSKENYSRLGYVTEGITTYMGDLYLAASGVKDWKWYKKELEKLLQRHFDNSGRFNYSVAESSFDTWLDGYVAGSPNRKVSIYNEGALLSFCLDAKIRTNNNNKKSLHDVMRELYNRFARNEKGYTERDFQGVVEEIADENLNEFFKNYYYGTHSFEGILAPALEQVGLQIKMKRNPSLSKSLFGVVCLIEQGKTVVKKIAPGSVAELGGIMHEDKLLAINGFEINNDLDAWLGYFEGKQLHITVSRKGRVFELTCPNTNKSYFPIYEIEKLKAPSNLQKRIFKKWCGSDWDEI